jgi:hypothetical protein
VEKFYSHEDPNFNYLYEKEPSCKEKNFGVLRFRYRPVSLYCSRQIIDMIRNCITHYEKLTPFDWIKIEDTEVVMDGWVDGWMDSGKLVNL